MLKQGILQHLLYDSLLYQTRKAIPRDGQHRRHVNKDNSLFQPGWLSDLLFQASTWKKNVTLSKNQATVKLKFFERQREAASIPFSLLHRIANVFSNRMYRCYLQQVFFMKVHLSSKLTCSYQYLLFVLSPQQTKTLQNSSPYLSHADHFALYYSTLTFRIRICPRFASLACPLHHLEDGLSPPFWVHLVDPLYILCIFKKCSSCCSTSEIGVLEANEITLQIISCWNFIPVDGDGQ